MSDTNGSESPTRKAQDDGGVLANLPRTRPQRASARRTAARRAGAPKRAAMPKAKDPRGASTAVDAPRERASKPATARRGAKASGVARSTTHPKAARAKASSAMKPRGAGAASARRTTPVEEAAPRQGFECDGESAGGSLQPPGSAEFVASAAEIVGELAKAGLSRSERLLKDVFSRLPGA